MGQDEEDVFSISLGNIFSLCIFKHLDQTQNLLCWENRAITKHTKAVDDIFVYPFTGTLRAVLHRKETYNNAMGRSNQCNLCVICSAAVANATDLPSVLK